MAEPAKPNPKANKTYWQPSEDRDRAPDDGRKWSEEDAAAARTWSEWVEKNGLPLDKYRPF